MDETDELKVIINKINATDIDTPIDVMDIMENDIMKQSKFIESEPKQIEEINDTKQSKFEQVSINKGRRKKRTKRKKVNIGSLSNDHIASPKLFDINQKFEESEEMKESKEVKEIKERKEIKEIKEIKEMKEMKGVKEVKEVKEMKEM